MDKPRNTSSSTTASERQNESLLSFFSNAAGAKLSTFKENNENGFTLIELLVVIAIISLLSSVVLASLASARASARDARRLADMRQIVTALEMYYNDHGEYPEENYVNNCGGGGWECTLEGNGEFLDVLVDDGYLASYIVDPVNSGSNFYKYHLYTNGDSGCNEPFYVLAVNNFESVDGNHPDSPGWECPTRNWQGNEGEWVTGSFE